MGRQRLDPIKNWWTKVDRRGPDECWPWKAGTDRDGYGKFAVGLGGKRQQHVRAHRFGFGAIVRPLQPGEVVCHTCDNPPCCNPAHWFAGTPLDNNDDKTAKGRAAHPWGTPLTRSRQTHCKRQHEFTPENTRIYVRNGREQRRCKECELIHARNHYRRHAGHPRGRKKPPTPG